MTEFEDFGLKLGSDIRGDICGDITGDIPGDVTGDIGGEELVLIGVEDRVLGVGETEPRPNDGEYCADDGMELFASVREMLLEYPLPALHEGISDRFGVESVSIAY